ncbi:MAG: hypothetical protein U9R37_04970 [Campylobacterota bacterium]|nr:hypothetical protein [Campylobacterota bacterium]
MARKLYSEEFRIQADIKMSNSSFIIRIPNNIFKQMNSDIVLNGMIIIFHINEDTKIKNLDNLIIQCNEKFDVNTLHMININNDLAVGVINISVMSFHEN